MIVENKKNLITDQFINSVIEKLSETVSKFIEVSEEVDGPDLSLG